MTCILKKLTSFEFEKKEYIRGKHTRYDAQARLENSNKKKNSRRPVSVPQR
jgi:hypothetical protein